MKDRKHVIYLFFVIVLLMGMTVIPVVAEAADIRVFVDEEEITISAAPRIVNGRTLVRMRPVCEEIGADVAWDQVTNTATITRAGKEIHLQIDSLSATVNGEAYSLDVAPVLIEGRTMLPLRFLMEQMSQVSRWDAAANTIYITEDMSFVTAANDMRPWLLGCGAILAQRNMLISQSSAWTWEDISPYYIGMSTRGVRYVENQRNLLLRDWSIGSREDLIATIERMTDYGHSANFEADVSYGKTLREQGLYEAMLAEASEVDAYMWPLVMRLDEKWGEKAIKAWDWFRMIHLAGWGYIAGYLELEETYALCAPVVDRLKSTFSSWDEATDNYMDGYAYWARIDTDPAKGESEYTQRYGYYIELKAAQETNGLLFDPSVWNR